MGILLAVIALVGWGTADVLTAVATRRIGSYLTTFYTFLIGAIISTPYLFFDHHHLTARPVLLSLGLAVIGIFSYLAFIEALRVGNPTLVGTITGSFIALVVLFSVVFLGEHLSGIQLIFVLIALAGIILTSVQPRMLREGIRLDRGTILALLVLLAWGIYFTFVKLPIREIGWFWPGYLEEILALPVLLIVLRGKFTLGRSREHHRGKVAVTVSAVIVTVGTFAYYGALTSSQVALVAPIAGSAPVLFVILSRIIFKERVAITQWLGIALALAGVVGLATVS